MVGSGGIGCELLKDLVLLGVGEIHVIDLDTVDLSNLNRQFLFSRKDIKQPKSVVAAQTASKFNPAVKIVPYLSDVKNTDLFPVDWFAKFDVIYNALDNEDARTYVNRMCLLVNKPLIECGTAGYNGQTQVILNGVTECYSCISKPTAKTFAICTIRSTPSQPVHVVVWAKNFLFSQLFDFNENSEDLIQQEATSDESEEKKLEREAMNKEINELQGLKDSIFEQDFAKSVFDKVFGSDIETLASIDTMWKLRKRPDSLSYDKILETINTEKGDNADLQEYAKQCLAADQKCWTIAEAFSVFNDSILRLQQRIIASANSKQTQPGQKQKYDPISFDKDDEDTLDFVVSAAQLRAYIFHIATKSKFDYKQIAGNIIPAIATTNAICAGGSVLQTIKLIKGMDFSDRIPEQQNGECHSKNRDMSKQTSIVEKNKEVVKFSKNMFLSINRRGATNLFALETPHQANPVCAVCQANNLVIHVDRSKTLLRDIAETLVTNHLKYSDEFSMRIGGDIIYEPDFDDSLDMTLEQLKIKDNSFLTVVDELDEHEDEESGTTTGPRANLELYIVDIRTLKTPNGTKDKEQEEYDVQKELSKVPLIEFKTKYLPPPLEEEGEDDDELLVDDEDSEILQGTKRKLDSDKDPGQSFKKLKVSDENGREIVEIDLDSDDDLHDAGTITLD